MNNTGKVCNPCIYFFRDNPKKAIKIGKSTNIEYRYREFATSHAEPLELLGVISGYTEEEGQLHARFDHIRLEGEWFKATPELIRFIESCTAHTYESYMVAIKYLNWLGGKNEKLAPQRELWHLIQYNKYLATITPTLTDVEKSQIHFEIERTAMWWGHWVRLALEISPDKFLAILETMGENAKTFFLQMSARNQQAFILDLWAYGIEKDLPPKQLSLF